MIVLKNSNKHQIQSISYIGILHKHELGSRNWARKGLNILPVTIGDRLDLNILPVTIGDRLDSNKVLGNGKDSLSSSGTVGNILLKERTILDSANSVGLLDHSKGTFTFVTSVSIS